MLYIDAPRVIPADHSTAPRCFLGKEAAHLFADSEEELIRYAASIGLKREWLQKRGTPWAHFDLTGSRLARALRDRRRVRQISAREIVQRIWKREKLCA